jgi:hypothetical protein
MSTDEKINEVIEDGIPLLKLIRFVKVVFTAVSGTNFGKYKVTAEVSPPTADATGQPLATVTVAVNNQTLTPMNRQIMSRTTDPKYWYAEVVGQKPPAGSTMWADVEVTWQLQSYEKTSSSPVTNP